MKKNSNQTRNDRAGNPGKASRPVKQDTKEVMAELVVKLSQKFEPQPAGESAAEGRQRDVPGPNRSRLTVGVDLGDKWSNYCIVGLDGEMLTEGQLRTISGISKSETGLEDPDIPILQQAKAACARLQ